LTSWAVRRDAQESLEKLRALGVDLDRLSRLTVITGVITNECPLRVGKGRGELGEPTDLPVEKLPDGRPYIPGSSLKGALRSLAERIANAMDLRTCNVFSRLSPCELAAAAIRKAIDALTRGDVEVLSRGLSDILSRAKQSGEEVVKGLAEDISGVISGLNQLEQLPEAISSLVEKLAGLPCPVCRLFGNKELAAHVHVLNAFPLDENVKIHFRTRVAIDRFRKAAHSGALFDYEFVPPGHKWELHIRVYNLDFEGRDEASRLLRSVFDYIREVGLEVGSMKSVGHGLLRLEELRCVVYRIEDFRVRREEVSLS